MSSPSRKIGNIVCDRRDSNCRSASQRPFPSSCRESISALKANEPDSSLPTTVWVDDESGRRLTSRVFVVFLSNCSISWSNLMTTSSLPVKKSKSPYKSTTRLIGASVFSSHLCRNTIIAALFTLPAINRCPGPPWSGKDFPNALKLAPSPGPLQSSQIKSLSILCVFINPLFALLLESKKSSY